MSVIMVMCAEEGGSMHRHEERIIAYVIGKSEKDCKKKFVRKHLNYEGDDWEAQYNKWIEMWCYAYVAQPVIE